MPTSKGPEFQHRDLDLVSQVNPVVREVGARALENLDCHLQHQGVSKTVIRLVDELAVDGSPVAVTCRVLEVAPSTLYEAVRREPSPR